MKEGLPTHAVTQVVFSSGTDSAAWDVVTSVSESRCIIRTFGSGLTA